MKSKTKETILFILPFLPYPLKSGGHQALYNGIRAVKDDFDVFVAYEAEDTDEYRNAENQLKSLLSEVTLLPLLIEVPPPPQPKPYYPNRLSWRIKNKFWTKVLVRFKTEEAKPIISVPNVFDWWVDSLCPANKTFAEHLDKIFQEWHFDIVQVEMPWMVGCVYNIPEGIKKVFVHHEIAFVRHELEIKELGKSPELLAYADYTKMIEVNLLNKYDTIITLSDIDKKKLIDAGVVSPIERSFAIVDTDKGLRGSDIKKTLSFIGSGIHNPNYLGIKWFLENCWPNLKNQDNEYQLHIIGEWSPETIKEITSRYQDVQFLGFVDDLSSAILGTTMIVPITVGSGIRMKILEAAAGGVPFVSTSVGAEGLPIENGLNGLIADSPEEFIQAIFQLEDENLRNKIVRNAYYMVQERFSIDALRANRVGIIDKLLDLA